MVLTEHHDEILTSVPCPPQPCILLPDEFRYLWASASAYAKARLYFSCHSKGYNSLCRSVAGSYSKKFLGLLVLVERSFGAFSLPFWKWKVPTLEDTLFFIFGSQLLLPRVPYPAYGTSHDAMLSGIINPACYWPWPALLCEYIRSKINVGNSCVLIFLQISAPRWMKKTCITAMYDLRNRRHVTANLSFKWSCNPASDLIAHDCNTVPKPTKSCRKGNNRERIYSLRMRTPVLPHHTEYVQPLSV